MNAYQVIGNTEVITATATSSEINITPQETLGLGGVIGPKYLKITNGSADQNVYFKTGLTSQTAVIPTAGSPGSTPIPAYGEVIIQVAADSVNPPATVYVAAVAASSSTVYVTPVVLAGF
jgi:hypothetical protein